jgi:hypothetical protein
VLEFTDSFHLSSVPNDIYTELLKLVRPESYALNRLKRRQVMRWCNESDLRPVGCIDMPLRCPALQYSSVKKNCIDGHDICSVPPTIIETAALGSFQGNHPCFV